MSMADNSVKQWGTSMTRLISDVEWLMGWVIAFKNATDFICNQLQLQSPCTVENSKNLSAWYYMFWNVKDTYNVLKYGIWNTSRKSQTAKFKNCRSLVSSTDVRLRVVNHSIRWDKAAIGKQFQTVVYSLDGIEDFFESLAKKSAKQPAPTDRKMLDWYDSIEDQFETVGDQLQVCGELIQQTVHNFRHFLNSTPALKVKSIGPRFVNDNPFSTDNMYDLQIKLLISDTVLELKEDSDTNDNMWLLNRNSLPSDDPFHFVKATHEDLKALVTDMGNGGELEICPSVRSDTTNGSESAAGNENVGSASSGVSGSTSSKVSDKVDSASSGGRLVKTQARACEESDVKIADNAQGVVVLPPGQPKRRGRPPKAKTCESADLENTEAASDDEQSSDNGILSPEAVSPGPALSRRCVRASELIIADTSSSPVRTYNSAVLLTSPELTDTPMACKETMNELLLEAQAQVVPAVSVQRARGDSDVSTLQAQTSNLSLVPATVNNKSAVTLPPDFTEVKINDLVETVVDRFVDIENSKAALHRVVTDFLLTRLSQQSTAAQGHLQLLTTQEWILLYKRFRRELLRYPNYILPIQPSTCGKRQRGESSEEEVKAYKEAIAVYNRDYNSTSRRANRATATMLCMVYFVHDGLTKAFNAGSEIDIDYWQSFDVRKMSPDDTARCKQELATSLGLKDFSVQIAQNEVKMIERKATVVAKQRSNSSNSSSPVKEVRGGGGNPDAKKKKKKKTSASAREMDDEIDSGNESEDIGEELSLFEFADGADDGMNYEADDGINYDFNDSTPANGSNSTPANAGGSTAVDATSGSNSNSNSNGNSNGNSNSTAANAGGSTAIDATSGSNSNSNGNSNGNSNSTAAEVGRSTAAVDATSSSSINSNSTAARASSSPSVVARALSFSPISSKPTTPENSPDAMSQFMNLVHTLMPNDSPAKSLILQGFQLHQTESPASISVVPKTIQKQLFSVGFQPYSSPALATVNRLAALTSDGSGRSDGQVLSEKASEHVKNLRACARSFLKDPNDKYNTLDMSWAIRAFLADVLVCSQDPCLPKIRDVLSETGSLSNWEAAVTFARNLLSNKLSREELNKKTSPFSKSRVKRQRHMINNRFLENSVGYGIVLPLLFLLHGDKVLTAKFYSGGAPKKWFSVSREVVSEVVIFDLETEDDFKFSFFKTEDYHIATTGNFDADEPGSPQEEVQDLRE